LGAALTIEQIRFARDLLAHTENTVTSIVKLLDVSRNTIYKYIPELHTGPALSATSPESDPGYVRPLRARVTGPGTSQDVRDRIQGKGRPGKF
jgi:hypothetical protein